MKTLKLTLSDETLRDGEQQVGVSLSSAQKRTLAHLIAQTGVHQIAAMPAIHATEAQLVRSLVRSGLQSQMLASTLMSKLHIDQAIACGVQQIILFHAVSDRLMLLRDRQAEAVLAQAPQSVSLHLPDESPPDLVLRSRQSMLAKVLEHLRYAQQQGLRICFAAEDASRADFHFLVDCIDRFSPYLDHFLLCDTVGCLTPEKTYVWLRDLRQCTQSASLMVHFHNDMGLALENTIQAVQAGATGVSGTFGGIGERAGNVALEQVLNGLRLRFGYEVEGIDYTALSAVTDYLDRLNIRANPPYSAQAQRHESGIHVHSLLRDRQSYAIFPHSQIEIWFGKHSGSSNVRYLFEQQLQQPQPPEEYDRLSQAIKALAIQENRSFSLEEIVLLWQQGQFDR